MQDNTKIIGVTNLKQAGELVIPDHLKDRVITDRAATQQEALAAMDQDVLDHADKPIAVWLDAQELGMLYATGAANPREFMQYLLAKFKRAGAPVEGSLTLKLAHGAVAKVKPDPAMKQYGWNYVWLPVEYVVAIQKGAAQ